MVPSLFSDFLLYKESLPLKPSSVDAISGACMLVKREALEDVGLWDGNTSHCEDLDGVCGFGFVIGIWFLFRMPG